MYCVDVTAASIQAMYKGVLQQRKYLKLRAAGE